MLLSMLGVNVFAHDIEVANSDGVTIYYTFNNDKTELAVSYYGRSFSTNSDEYSGNVIIPESVIYEGSTYPVTSIGPSAFRGCVGLTGVTIPNSVTSIGNNAFQDCSGLSNVIIPNSVSTTGSNAFYNCSALTNIIIPSSITSIGSHPFYGCSSLTDVTFYCKEIKDWFRNSNTIKNVIIGDGVETIGSYAFYGCSGLTNVTISNSVTTINASAFQDCSSLASIVIPNSVTNIGRSAFQSCSGLTSITIPNSVISIGSSAFLRCDNLSSVSFNCKEIKDWFRNNKVLQAVIIGDEVETIGALAFDGCSNLTSVHIGNAVTTIKGHAFENCIGLTEITIPNSVISIGNSICLGCTNLSNAIIGNSVSTIEAAAFSGCTNLKSVSIGKSVENIETYAFRNCDALTSITFYTKEIKSWFSQNESIKELIFEDEVKSIGSRAFSGCSGLISLNLNNSITSIGDEAFSGCSGLTNIDIGNSVISIGKSAFSSCNSLTNVIIPNSVATIPYSAFLNCSSLSNVVIGNSVTLIDQYAFRDCGNLKSISIPNSVIVIGKSSFSGCTSLESAVIGSSVTTINDWAFSGCNSLTNLVIPNSVVTIGEYAFQACNSLVDLNIPNSVNTIGNYAFKKCSSLINVDIPGSVTSIGAYAFEDCTNLVNVIIPNSITVIEPFTFNNCVSLTSVDIPNSVTTIGGCAFSGCTNLTDVNIPSSVITINNSAFTNCSSLTTIEIPYSVQSIGSFAFYCNNLSTIKSYIEVPFAINKDVFADENYSNATLYVPSSVIGAYQNTDGWKNFLNIREMPGLYYEDSITKVCYGYKKGNPNAFVIPSVSGIQYSGNIELLSDFTIDGYTYNVTSISSSAFSGCTDLTSISIPSTISSIERSAFEGCSGLTAYNVDDGNAYFKSIDGVLFNNDGTTLIDYPIAKVDASYIIPDGVTNIIQNAFNGNIHLTSMEIPGSVTSIDSYAFYCNNLTSITSFIMEPFPISSDVFSNECYSNATLYVPVYVLDAYRNTAGWNNFYNIKTVGADNTSTVSLEVKNDAGTDITNSVNILWYNEAKEQIGSGSSLGGIEKNATVYYSVLLDEMLGREYREINYQKVMANDNKEICQLEKIGRVLLEGRVSAIDIDKVTMNVNVKQMLNGKWEENSQTLTNERGEFKIDLYDDVTNITISGEGYLDVNLHRDNFNGNGNVGTILVNLISGITIETNISIQKAVKEGEDSEITTWTEGLSNMEFVLINNTKGTTINDFTIQNNNLIVRTGIDAGDILLMIVKSKLGIFVDESTEFPIIEGTNRVDIILKELGGLEATCVTSDNSSTIGYLYDGKGQLVARGSYIGETLRLSHLTCGTYTLVSIGNSLLFGNLSKLTDYASVGLYEGTDFVTTLVEVVDGKLTILNVPNVPHLTETQFYYTTGNTYFNADMSSVTAGNYLILNSHVDFKKEYADKIGDVKLTIDLPEGCQMVDNSVIANGKVLPYTISDNHLVIFLNKGQWQNQIRFCIIPTLNKGYTLTAIASFDINGQIDYPIGTAKFDVEGLSLSAPKQTNETKIIINGVAQANSNIKVFDNDVLIGNAMSNADGSWKTECELYKPYSHSFHNIYAKVSSSNGMELTSVVKQVEYDKNIVKPVKVRMLYYNHEFDQTFNIVFDLVNGTTTPSYYYFFPYKSSSDWWLTGETEPKDFIFLADFDRNDSTLINNVNIKVLNTDGTIRTLPAYYDRKQNCWVATTKYASSSRLPQNAMVEYDIIQKKPIDHSETLNDQIGTFINVATAIRDYFEEKVSFDIISETQDEITFQYFTDNMKKSFLSVKILDYESAVSMMDNVQFEFAKTDEGLMCYYVDDSNGQTNVYSVDIESELAIKICIWSDDVNCVRYLKRAAFGRFSSTIKVLRKIIKFMKEGTITLWKKGDLVAGVSGATDIIMDILDIEKYFTVIPDFELMVNTFDSYNTTLNKWGDAWEGLYYAKCPDGKYRFAPGNLLVRAEAFDSYMDLEDEQLSFVHNWGDKLISYGNRLNASILYDVATFAALKGLKLVGKATKFGVNKVNKINSWISKIPGTAMDPGTVTRIADNLLGTLTGAVDVIVNPKFADFESIRDDIMTWVPTESSKLNLKYNNACQYLMDNYIKCDNNKDEVKDEPVDEKTENIPEFLSKEVKVMQDPSGYVYEAVFSNRLPGVTTTVYEQVNGAGVKWNAEDYSQQNPLVTDDNGFYRWDVPMGQWQVKYEKDGYETTYTEWLPVPPPQLDVNVGLKQTTPPMVKQMRGNTSGITIDMSKYMLPATLNTNTISVTSNGMTTNGTIETLNLEKSPTDDAEFVSKVKFVPEMSFNTTDEVVVTVHKEVESYCGVQMTADHVETVKIEADINDLLADSVVSVPYQNSKTMQVIALPNQAVAGKKVSVKSSSDLIVSLNETEAELDSVGTATFTVNGNLPGSAYLTFSIDGTDLSVLSKVKVVMENNLVATPQASIKNGKTVQSGTQLVLSCSTEGATIYYTLDGSCPCDESARIKYESPIIINTDVIVKAIAVKDGMDDSDVATFVYVLDGGSNIKGTKTSGNIDMYYENGLLIVDGAEGATCHVYDYEGQELASLNVMNKHAAIRVPKKGVYLVSIQKGKSKAMVYKVVVR